MKDKILRSAYNTFISTYNKEITKVLYDTRKENNKRRDDFIAEWFDVNDQVSRKYKEKYGYNEHKANLRTINKRIAEIEELKKDCPLHVLAKYNEELKELEIERNYASSQIEIIDSNIEKGLAKNRSRREYEEKVKEINEENKVIEKQKTKELLLRLLEELKGLISEALYNEFYEMLKQKNADLVEIIEGEIKPPKKKTDSDDDNLEALKNATKLVEKAEATKDQKDIDIARKAVEALEDSKEKEELLKRLDAINVVITDDAEFLVHLQVLNNRKANNEEISESEMIRLRALYQNITKECKDENVSDVYSLIDYYNKLIQEKKKLDYQYDKKNNYNLMQYVVEVLGKPCEILLNSKLVRKLNKKRLQKAEAKGKTKKVEKINRILLSKDEVSGVRLFKSRNAINKLKPALYNGTDLPKKAEKKLSNAQIGIDSSLNNGLERKLKDTEIKDDDGRITNILDQYVELLSVTDVPDNAYENAVNVLNTFKSDLRPEVYLAYATQIDRIYKYRNGDSSVIYETDKNEINNVVKYYDSEEYKKLVNKLPYIG